LGVTRSDELDTFHDELLGDDHIWASLAKLLDVRLLCWRELYLGLEQQPAGLSW